MSTLLEIANSMADQVAAGSKVVFIVDGVLHEGVPGPGCVPPDGTYFFSPDEARIATMFFLPREQDATFGGFTQMDGEWGLNRQTGEGTFVWIPLADIEYDSIMNAFYRKSVAPDKEMLAMFDQEPRSQALRRIARRQNLLAYIRRYKSENHGQTPTFALMGEGAKVGSQPLSKSVVNTDLEYMESMGWLCIHRTGHGSSPVIIELPGETYTLPPEPAWVGDGMQTLPEYTGGPEADSDPDLEGSGL